MHRRWNNLSQWSQNAMLSCPVESPQIVHGMLSSCLRAWAEVFTWCTAAGEDRASKHAETRCTIRGRQGLKISTGSLLSGPNVEQAQHLADLHIRAGSLLPTANNEQAAKYQNFPRCPEY